MLWVFCGEMIQPQGGHVQFVVVRVRVLVLVLSFGLVGVDVVGSQWGSKLFVSIFVVLSR
jgi:hypothetical protein